MDEMSIESNAEILQKIVDELQEDRYGIPVQRLKELAKADRAGKVMVLPYKVGDTVYIRLWDKMLPFEVIEVRVCTGDRPVFSAKHGRNLSYVFELEDIGKTVFTDPLMAAEDLIQQNGGHD